jgi:hypothetical protein
MTGVTRVSPSSPNPWQRAPVIRTGIPYMIAREIYYKMTADVPDTDIYMNDPYAWKPYGTINTTPYRVVIYSQSQHPHFSFWKKNVFDGVYIHSFWLTNNKNEVFDRSETLSTLVSPHPSFRSRVLSIIAVVRPRYQVAPAEDYPSFSFGG